MPSEAEEEKYEKGKVPESGSKLNTSVTSARDDNKNKEAYSSSIKRTPISSELENSIREQDTSLKIKDFSRSRRNIKIFNRKSKDLSIFKNRGVRI